MGDFGTACPFEDAGRAPRAIEEALGLLIEEGLVSRADDIYTANQEIDLS